MQLPLPVGLVDKASGERVPGNVCAATKQHLLLWTDWRYNTGDEDRTWDWWGLYRECALSGGRCECYAALAANDLQGLMVLGLRAGKTGGRDHLIINYLATSPANRTADRGIKFVGIALIAVAIMRSIEEGAAGRIQLESLPGAEGFYENLGMARQLHRSPEGYPIYTLSPARAEQLLEQIKESGILAT